MIGYEGTSLKGSVAHRHRWGEVHHLVKRMTVYYYLGSGTLCKVLLHSVIYVLPRVSTSFESGSFVRSEANNLSVNRCMTNLVSSNPTHTCDL